MQKNIFIPVAIFCEIAQCVLCAKLIKQQPKSHFSFATLQLHEDMDQAVTYVRRMPITPGFLKGVICQVNEPANQESIGAICWVSKWLFSVGSYILVLRLYRIEV